MTVAHSPLFIGVVIAVLGFTIGLAKGGFNIIGALCTPILSLVLPVSLAVGVLLPMLLIGDAFAVYTYWREWDWPLIRRMMPASLVGALLGTWLLTRMDPNALRLALAGFVLLIVGYKFASERIARLAYQPAGWHGPLVGALSGMASGMFNTGGPPFNAYLLLQKLPARTFIASAALYFALVNLIKLPGFLITGVLDVPLLLSLWWVLLFIPVGLVVARWLVSRVNQRTFEWIIVALLVLSSALLFAQSL